MNVYNTKSYLSKIGLEYESWSGLNSDYMDILCLFDVTGDVISVLVPVQNFCLH